LSSMTDGEMYPILARYPNIQNSFSWLFSGHRSGER
jgi:hypothetical protein